MSEIVVDLLAHLQRAVDQAREQRKAGGTPHDHTEFVEGCFRCDLNRGEIGLASPAADDAGRQ